MKRMLIILLLLGFGVWELGFLVSGCGQVVISTAEITGGREYFPNTDGYSYTYRVLSYLTSEVGALKITISGTTEVSSINVQKFKAEYFTGNYSSTTESLLKVTDSYVKNYGTTTSPTTEVSNSLLFPLKVGNKWIVKGTYEAQVLTLETLNLPAGTYVNCFKIRSNSESGISNSWYAPQVGLVKGITGSITLELTSKNF